MAIWVLLYDGIGSCVDDGASQDLALVYWGDTPKVKEIPHHISRGSTTFLWKCLHRDHGQGRLSDCHDLSTVCTSGQLCL